MASSLGAMLADLQARLDRLDVWTGGSGGNAARTGGTAGALAASSRSVGAIEGRIEGIKVDMLRERVDEAVAQIDTKAECDKTGCAVCTAYCGSECATSFFHMIACGDNTRDVSRERRWAVCGDYIEAVQKCTRDNKDYFAKFRDEFAAATDSAKKQGVETL